MLAETVTRLDLGAGRYPAEGYVSVDQHQNADIQGDIRELHFHDVQEIRMSHLLEHFGWRETVPILSRVRDWMAPGGLLTVEVPDMAAIMAEAANNPDWIRYVYGSQEHDGEYHRTGFTRLSLWKALAQSGWRVVKVQAFRSEFRTRVGMPCLEARARA